MTQKLHLHNQKKPLLARESQKSHQTGLAKLGRRDRFGKMLKGVTSVISGTLAVTMLSMGSRVIEKDLFEIIRRQSEQIEQLIAENKALKSVMLLGFGGG
ncbi:hypothetical protein [Deinococcus marmoris]|uniref:hypothetical protein n=1 Tax=Deinococcus marmoris TaxID=249408 RepID=UPI0020C98DE5|nr:hypothetical protein [Deinococcus marmoris]